MVKVRKLLIKHGVKPSKIPFKMSVHEAVNRMMFAGVPFEAMADAAEISLHELSKMVPASKTKRSERKVQGRLRELFLKSQSLS